MKHLTFAIPMAICIAACGGEELECGGSGRDGDSLDGSYCEGLSIRFTDAEVRRQNSGPEYFIFIRYLDAAETPEMPRKVLEILIPSAAVVIEPNRQILLRMVAGATVRRFPSVEEGSIQAIDLTPELQDTSQVTFTEFTAEIGSNARGEFGLLLENGRTLRGTFASPILEIRAD